MLDSEMKQWISEGKNADVFPLKYDFQILWRTLARISLYATSIVLSFALIKKL